MRVELPILSPCVGCGNCCRSIGLPPFEVANPDLGPQPSVPTKGGCFSCAQDYDLLMFATMPAELRAAHAQLLRDLTEDPSGTPCAWFDAATGECVNYEHRPAACVLFVVGSRACVHLKSDPEVKCVWQDNTQPEVWRNPRSKERYASKYAKYTEAMKDDPVWVTPPTRWARFRKWLRRTRKRFLRYVRGKK